MKIHTYKYTPVFGLVYYCQLQAYRSQKISNGRRSMEIVSATAPSAKWHRHCLLCDTFCYLYASPGAVVKRNLPFGAIKE